MSKRQGNLIWNGAYIEWKYQTFKDDTTFELKPHFYLKATNPKTNEWVEWPSIEVSDDSLSEQIKGITDFTKLPKELMVGILDNAVNKLNESEPDITRISLDGTK